MILMFLAAYAAAVTQTVLVDAVAIRNVTPDVLALMLAIGILHRGERVFWPAAAVGIGLVADLLSTGTFGTATAGMVLAATLIVRSNVSGSSGLAAQWAVTAAAVSIANVLPASMKAWTDTGNMGVVDLARWSVLTGVYTAACGLPLLMVVQWLGEGPRSRSERLQAFS